MFEFHFKHEGGTHFYCVEGDCHQWLNQKLGKWMCDCENGYWKSVKAKKQMDCRHLRELKRRIGVE